MEARLMRAYVPQELQCNKFSYGLTLTELLITLAVLSILATAALPYAEVTVKRTKEFELRRSLRTVRTAIDRFHEDWRNGLILKSADGVSINGYPKNLDVLITGIETGKPDIPMRKYLRKVPDNPFADKDITSVDGWKFRGYQDDYDGSIWNSEDVYDIYPQTEKSALDESSYKEW